MRSVQCTEQPRLLSGLIALVLVLAIPVGQSSRPTWQRPYRTEIRSSGYGLSYRVATILPGFYSFYMLGLAKLMPYDQSDCSSRTGRTYAHSRRPRWARDEARGLQSVDVCRNKLKGLVDADLTPGSGQSRLGAKGQAPHGRAGGHTAPAVPRTGQRSASLLDALSTAVRGLIACRRPTYRRTFCRRRACPYCGP